MKKYVKGFLFAVLITLVLAGCGNGDENGNDQAGDSEAEAVELTLFSSVTNESDQAIFEEVIERFEEENDHIQIDYNFPTSEYESMMRVRMGADDMPDLFDTHGWAVNRYGDYTMDLRDMDWVDNLDPSLEPIITDDDGKVYAYPMNQANDGLTYNVGILEEYDIDVPETFDELMDALREIRDQSDGEVTPLWFPGSDRYSLGYFLDIMSTPLLVTHEDHDYSEELKAGEYGWDEYTYLPEKLLQMQEEDLLNVDVLTAQTHEQTQLFAQDKIGFVMGTLPVDSIHELNEDIELGIMPVPPIHDGGEKSWIGGERFTLAVAQNSDHPEEAKQFIEFLAQPDIAQKVAEGTNLPSGLENVSAEIYYQDFYEEYDDVIVEPYFDREFLPSGMWDVYGETAQELLSGRMTPEEVTEQMAAEYNRLYDEE
ncbi:extracellular solute-binding protein [Pelagirhabdus alkalitolerans]|nr:ABC transporter substrate-binding protein [Pelagirhabdus alkalitolerans]